LQQAAIDNIRDQNQTNLDFKTIMDPWLKQMGYPLVTVENAGDGTATVTASRYFNPRGQTAGITSEFK
jgi:aminopeptidase N